MSDTPNITPTKLCGCYSRKQEHALAMPWHTLERGSPQVTTGNVGIYLTDKGTTVEVTNVTSTPEDHHTGFNDIVFRGEVVQRVGERPAQRLLGKDWL